MASPLAYCCFRGFDMEGMKCLNSLTIIAAAFLALLP